MTKEVADAIKALEWSVNYESPGHQEDARAALLAAIEKYGRERQEIGYHSAERDWNVGAFEK